jgi:hypothetical protein
MHETEHPDFRETGCWEQHGFLLLILLLLFFYSSFFFFSDKKVRKKGSNNCNDQFDAFGIKLL